MNTKKWSIRILVIWLVLVLAAGGTVILVDPYHHYHKPLGCFTYNVGDAAYTNDGKCKNFDYEALITGTSMTMGFEETIAEELFGKTFLRATFLGEGFKRVGENLRTAIQHNEDLELVIRSVDTLWFVTAKDWMANEEYPEYLYNGKLLDDAEYLYNFDVWADALIPTLKTFRLSGGGSAGVSVPKDSEGKQYLDQEKALDNYVREPKQDTPMDENQTAEYFAAMKDNLYYNLLQVVEENPDIEFYFFFPPYSILWWDGINQAGPGRVDRRIDMEQYAIEMILAYDNVKLFSFFNHFDLICDLDYYSDDIHYNTAVSTMMLEWMKDGAYQLTKDNYMEYISEIRSFYTTYDYESMFR